jgi:hypothetical protein
VIDHVETRLDVGLQYPVVPLTGEVVDLGDRVLGAPVRAKPVRARLEPASKMGSSTNFSAACTTRSVTVGMPSRRSLPFDLGIITCRTATGWNIRAFTRARISRRNTSTPIRDSIQATVARSIPGVLDPAFAATRSHATTKNAGS